MLKQSSYSNWKITKLTLSFTLTAINHHNYASLQRHVDYFLFVKYVNKFCLFNNNKNLDSFPSVSSLLWFVLDFVGFWILKKKHLRRQVPLSLTFTHATTSPTPMWQAASLCLSVYSRIDFLSIVIPRKAVNSRAPACKRASGPAAPKLRSAAPETFRLLHRPH